MTFLHKQVDVFALQIDSKEPPKVKNVSVISQEDFAKIRPHSVIHNPARVPPPPPINTPCVAGSLLVQHDNDLDQLDFTFGDEDADHQDSHNKSNLSR